MLRLRPFDSKTFLNAFEVHSNVRHALVDFNTLLGFHCLISCLLVSDVYFFGFVALKFHRFAM